MREISKATVNRSTNCGGPDQVFTAIIMAVEESDIGREYPHYLGHKCAGYRIKASDVDRVAVRMLQPGYDMWYFR